MYLGTVQFVQIHVAILLLVATTVRCSTRSTVGSSVNTVSARLHACSRQSRSRSVRGSARAPSRQQPQPVDGSAHATPVLPALPKHNAAEASAPARAKDGGTLASSTPAAARVAASMGLCRRHDGGWRGTAALFDIRGEMDQPHSGSDADGGVLDRPRC